MQMSECVRLRRQGVHINAVGARTAEILFVLCGRALNDRVHERVAEVRLVFGVGQLARTVNADQDGFPLELRLLALWITHAVISSHKRLKASIADHCSLGRRP